MKTLPDSANLDHLRRQAKDLLAVMRQSEPATALAEAQRSLAAQYGYDSWKELKAAAEARRSAPVTVADAAVTEALVEESGLGAATGPMRRIERVWAGHVWEVDTTGGRAVLTELFDYVQPEHVEVVAGL